MLECRKTNTARFHSHGKSKIVEHIEEESSVVHGKGWGQGRIGRYWSRAPSFSYAR